MNNKHLLGKLLVSGRLVELLDSMALLGDQIIQIMTSDGELYARTNVEGRCLITASDIASSCGVRTIPSLCVKRQCPWFSGQYFSPVNIRSDNVGVVVGCYKTPDASNRAHIEFVSRVFSEIVTREEEIAVVRSDIMSKYQELSILYEVSRSISSSFSELEVAVLLIGLAAQGLNVSEAAVFLRDPSTNHFRETVSLSGNVSDSNKVLSPDVEKCFAPLFTDSSPVIDTDTAGRLLFGMNLEKVLLVPLVHYSSFDSEAQLLGVMALAGKKSGSFSADDSQFLSTLTTQGALGIVNCRAVKSLREGVRLDRDLELGQSIQQSFFPEIAPSGDNFSIAGQCIPARKVGGDYFDFFTNENGEIIIIIADVSGHHLGSAILMGSIRTVLRTALLSGESPVDTLKLVNKAMYADMDRVDSFVSIFIASFDPVSQVVSCASAGHNPPLLLLPPADDGPECCDCSVKGTKDCPVHEGKACQYSVPVDVDGILIGIVPDYPFAEKSIQLKPDSLLFLYTDGAIEAVNDEDELFGMDRLGQILCANRHRCPDDLCTFIKKEVESFSKGTEQQDDLTMVALKVF